MNKSILLLLMLISGNLIAQKVKKYELNKISKEEHAMTAYALDSTANAVFLSEYGDTKFVQMERGIYVITTYYAKIKIFNKEGYDQATVEIPIFRNNEKSERVKNIKAFTNNGSRRTVLAKKDIFTTEQTKNWSTVSFTMPEIKEGSIIEYEYELETPFFFNFKGWEFQAEIPKIYSEFHALIPGNYVYHRRLNGNQGLTVNEASIKRRCFSIAGIDKQADCENLTYAMTNVPAFIEEDYMTSKKNYLSAIQFELSEYRGFRGQKFKYTKSWKDVDTEFKGEKSIGRQLRKIDYIKKQLPVELLNGEHSLEHAQKIYKFIQDHFTWDNKYEIFKNVNVKNAFDKKIGNSTEINISLINALTACGYDTELMLLATRSQGFPTKIYPVMTDFNYAIAKLNINNNTYLLDARESMMPFGMLPYNLLNGYGRVMNFKNGSYWYDIVPNAKNQRRILLSLELDLDGNLTGKLNSNNTGYDAYDHRNTLLSKSEDEYLSDFEEKNEGLNLTVSKYTNKHLEDLSNNISETFEIEIESDLNTDSFIINPFLQGRIITNPFNLTERSYPVDFGYPFSRYFMLNIKLPENYKLAAVIPPVGLKLPNGGGQFQFAMEQKGRVISLMSKIVISKAQYHPDEYAYLKEFYKQIIKTHKSLITLEKI